MIKIAISGKAKSGKGTLSKLFAKQFPDRECKNSFLKGLVKEGGTKIIAFANPIKEIAEIMFPEAKYENLYGASELREQIIDSKYKDKNNNLLTYRQALLDIGSLGRSYNKDLWLNKTKMYINKFPPYPDLLIVNDIRFINEFEALKEDNFYTIRIKRNNSAVINDISETQQEEILDSSFDCIIENNSSIEHLESTVLSIINKIA